MLTALASLLRRSSPPDNCSSISSAISSSSSRLAAFFSDLGVCPTGLMLTCHDNSYNYINSLPHNSHNYHNVESVTSICACMCQYWPMVQMHNGLAIDAQLDYTRLAIFPNLATAKILAGFPDLKTVPCYPTKHLDWYFWSSTQN